MKLTVIIVNYNVKYYVEQCLDSLAKALGGIESEIFVVDNHSRDGSVAYLRERYTHVHIIDCNHNLGFARANNIAINQSSGEYVLLLNPDTFVAEDTIRAAIDFMDSHPKVGGMGVKMYNPDGTLAMESRRGLPTPMTSFYKMCGLCARYPKSRRFGRYYMSYLGWDSPERIEIVSGAFCFLRRSAIEKIGCLDEDFFMYGEDIDLSFRLLKGGYENWYLPHPILHYKGESTHKTSFRYVHVFYQAMLIFFRKHYGHLGAWITLPIKAAIYVKAMMALLHMIPHNIRKSLGFPDKDNIATHYIYIGSRSMTEHCMNISRRVGLSAECHCADGGDMESVRKTIDTAASRSILTYVVYDTDMFGYGQILEMMAVAPNPKIVLGTYNCKTKIIITPDDIIK
ncbi:MAG: glycosyltransferase family 2 protein [Prevotella sp.]|nr:glycosyltransferase family 2 protein [Prevotella sp.]